MQGHKLDRCFTFRLHVYNLNDQELLDWEVVAKMNNKYSPNPDKMLICLYRL